MHHLDKTNNIVLLHLVLYVSLLWSSLELSRRCVFYFDSEVVTALAECTQVSSLNRESSDAKNYKG
jgi:hypothetical protein